MDAYPVKATEPEIWLHFVRLLGTGADVPTKEIGQGITVTRADTGVLVFTWAENPGTFIGMYRGFRATTPGDVDRFDIVHEAYDATTRSLQMTVYNESGSAADLAAAQYVSVMLAFKLINT